MVFVQNILARAKPNQRCDEAFWITIHDDVPGLIWRKEFIMVGCVAPDVVCLPGLVHSYDVSDKFE